jgi:hypothetical protein
MHLFATTDAQGLLDQGKAKSLAGKAGSVKRT